MAGIVIDNINDCLAISLQDGNGVNTYSNERAVFGYVEAYENIALPTGHPVPPPFLLNVNDLGKMNAIQNFIGPAGDAFRAAHPYLTGPNATSFQTLKFIILNSYRLVHGSVGKADAVNPERSIVIATIRDRIVKIGGLIADRATRGVTYDEVTAPLVGVEGDINLCANANAIYALADPTVVSILAKLSEPMMNERIKWCVKNADTIVCMVELFMRTRGHHYKDIFLEAIKKVYVSVAEGNEDPPSWVNWKDVMRTATHGIGMKVLPSLAVKIISYGKTGNGLIIRFEGAPTGTAVLTTGAAALDMIGGESWYHIFEKGNKQTIEDIRAISRLVLNNKYNYHMSANLYGVDPLRTCTVRGIVMSMSECEAIVSRVAPVLQGFITWTQGRATDATKSVFSFRNAKALEKRASSNPVMMLKLKALLDLSISSIEDAESMADAQTQAFPAIMDDPAKAPVV